MTVPADLLSPDGFEAFKSHFEATEARIHAFVTEPARVDRWRDELAALAGTAEPGPLHGLPLGVKDIFHVEGLPTGAGSDVPSSVLTGQQGPAVARLRAAGAFLVGKTTTTEFAYFAPAATRNPHALDRTPGGSSSGSAAAIASGQCALALGTQTIGSIGRPAAFCGVLGYKPSYDRVERDGVIPLAESLDHVGLFAPDLALLQRGAAVLVPDWAGVPEESARQLRLGVPNGPYLDALEPAGRRHFERVQSDFLAAGHQLIPCDLFPDFSSLAHRHRRLMAAECASTHQTWLREHRARYRTATLELIDRGLTIDPAEVAEIREARLDLRQRVDAALNQNQLDLWLTPPAPGPAPLGLESTGDPSLNLPWSQAGVPTLVLPAGKESGLPLGIQLAGRFGRDEELLSAAARLLTALPVGAQGAHS